MTIPDAAETEPVIVRVPKPFAASRMRTVTPFPVRSTVAEVPTNAEPAPDVSQFPDTVHEPEAVMVPEGPPVSATLATLTADVHAVSAAAVATMHLPLVRASDAVKSGALLFRASVPRD